MSEPGRNPGFRDLFRLLARLGAANLALHAALTVAQAALPWLGLYAMKLLIDSISHGIAGGDRATARTELHGAVLFASLVAFAGIALRAVSAHLADRQARRLQRLVARELHDHCLQLDVGTFDRPAFHDQLHRAAQEAGTRPARVLMDSAAWLGALVSLLLMAGTLAFAASWLAAIVVAAALPSVWLRLRRARWQFELGERTTNRQRQAGYLGSLLTSRNAQKEARLSGAGAHWSRRLDELRADLDAQALALHGRHAAWDVAAQSLGSAAMFAAYLFLGGAALAGELGLGDLVMLAQAVQRAQGAVRDLLLAGAALVEDRLFLRHWFAFRNLRPLLAEPEAPVALPPGPLAVHCRRVGFVYPGTARPVFEDLELQLAPGEHALLVGPNGAGKSTLVRLLLRLCDPTTGTVTAGDVDLRAVGSPAWQRRCSVLFQDAVPFDLTVRENVTCSDPGRDDETALWHALALVGLAERVRTLPQQLDTLLGRRLGEGAELSAGEWRRLLLARAIYRRAELYIVDEATAFLDREGVAQVLPALAAHWRGATVLWIDHRDALAPFVQRTIEWRSICRAR